MKPEVLVRCHPSTMRHIWSAARWLPTSTIIAARNHPRWYFVIELRYGDYCCNVTVDMREWVDLDYHMRERVIEYRVKQLIDEITAKIFQGTFRRSR